MSRVDPEELGRQGRQGFAGLGTHLDVGAATAGPPGAWPVVPEEYSMVAPYGWSANGTVDVGGDDLLVGSRGPATGPP